MKIYTGEELKVILDNHEKWLNNDDNGVRADLRNADLGGVNLGNVNLYGADLRNADLRNAYLRNADLRNADLGGADLRNADLRNADLGGADLRNVNLGGVFGNMKHVKSLQIEKYYITYTSKIIQIGCQSYTIEEWKNFNNKSILEMDGKRALEWWNKWKPIIMQIIEMSPCEPTKEDDKDNK